LSIPLRLRHGARNPAGEDNGGDPIPQVCEANEAESQANARKRKHKHKLKLKLLAVSYWLLTRLTHENKAYVKIILIILIILIC